jgi:hypothetical protein
VVGAAAEAGIIGGYPDGSFGPKRPTSRAEAVVMLNRALPTPIGPTPTPTPGAGTGSVSEPTGTRPRLTGLTIDGVTVPGFDPTNYNYTVSVGSKTSVTIAATSASNYSVAYRQGTSGNFTTGASSFQATAPGTVEIKAYRRTAGVNDGIATTYTITLTPGETPGGTLWEEIERIEFVTGSVPQFGVNYTDLTIYIKAAYQGQIASISVKNTAAAKQAGTPETWTVSMEGHIALSDLAYGDIIVTRTSTPSALPEEIERVDISLGSVPQFGVDYSDLTLYIKAAYANQIAAITVGGNDATKQTGTPETWTVSLNGHVTQEQVAEMINVVRVGGGSREEVEIQGNWPAPISRVTKQDASVPQFNVAITDVRVYVSTTVTGIRVKGENANYANGVWLASFNQSADSFTLSAGDVQVLGYDPGPTDPPSAELGISRFIVGYDYNGGGYMGFVNLNILGDLNVQSIRITDAAGALVAEYPGGALNKINNYQYNGLVEAVPGADVIEVNANAALLAGKEVTVTVTGISGETKTATAQYQYDAGM